MYNYGSTSSIETPEHLGTPKENPIKYAIPYDELIFTSMLYPCDEALSELCKRNFYKVSDRGHYRHFLHLNSKRYGGHVNLWWGPRYPNCPRAIIKINPLVLQYSPNDVLDLLSSIFCDLEDVWLSTYTATIDLQGYSQTQISTAIYRPYLRNFNDYLYPGETTYLGSRFGSSQVRVYDKGKEQGLDPITPWTRIERTVHLAWKDRPTALDFLQGKVPLDPFTSVYVTDVDKLDGRTRIGKSVSKIGVSKSLKNGSPLSDGEKKRLRDLVKSDGDAHADEGRKRARQHSFMLSKLIPPLSPREVCV